MSLTAAEALTVTLQARQSIYNAPNRTSEVIDAALSLNRDELEFDKKFQIGTF